MTELRVNVSVEVAERLASEAAERGTSPEALAADVLSRHLPSPAEHELAFIGMFEALGTLSVADAERQLEDGQDDGFPR